MHVLCNTIFEYSLDIFQFLNINILIIKYEIYFKYFKIF